MKRQLKMTMSKIGITENSTLLKPYRYIATSIRNSRIPEKSADMLGLFASQMVPESELKSLWKMVEPHSNGHDLVRVGGDGDGGYLLPNDFRDINYCFSPGAGAIWTFEEALGASFGIESFVCDGTIENFPSFGSLKSFMPKNVGLA
jgi:hypothetical protein